MTQSIDYAPAGPVCQEYLEDRSQVSLIEGPVGSGKTVASLMKGFMVSVQQQAHLGVRYSRGMVLRNTYPELKSTVIKSFEDWFPGSIAPIRWDAPITASLKFPLADGTKLDCEIYFLSFDRPDDIGKLKSFEVTWAALSEMNELAKVALDMSTQRVGRYPPNRLGGPTWYGVFGDTNMPDDDSWVYRLFEKDKPEGYKLFKQPGGLIERLGKYTDNPAAENVANLPGGYKYYHRQIGGKNKEWIKVFLLAQYGTITAGKPVYPEWNDDLHCKATSAHPTLPLLLGFDYGLTPACAICQVSPRGQLLVLDELFAKDMGIRQFARDVVRPHLALNYPKHGFQACGDPAGMAKSQTDEKSCFMELAEEGIACVPASTNAFIGRREAVAKYLTRMVDGQPALIVDPRCDMIRRGFNGRYQYKRLQVVGEERYRDVADKNDFSHCFVGNTPIEIPGGRRAIARIKVGDMVVTPLGPKAVTATMSRESSEFAEVRLSNGRHVWCTPDHPFILPDGIVPADALRYNDVLIGINTKEESQWADQQSIQSRPLTGSGTTASARAITKPISGYLAAFGTCTVTFGSFIAALFLMGLRFTTWTTTKAITTSAIWSWSVVESMLLYMAESVQPITRLPRESTWSGSGRLLLNGMDQRLVWNGTPPTAEQLGLIVTSTSTNASSAVRSTKPWSERARKAIALLLAKVRLAERLAWTMSKESALSVLRLLRSTNTARLAPALRIAGVELYQTLRPVKVFDLTVEDAHCFYAGGVLVHNCHDALQYAALHSLNMNLSEEWTKPIKYPELGIA